MNQSQIQNWTASVIAVMAVGTGAFIAIDDAITNRPITDVPVWLGLLIGAIVGSYFTQHASVNGARQAGTAAAQAAIAAENAATKA